LLTCEDGSGPLVSTDGRLRLKCESVCRVELCVEKNSCGICVTLILPESSRRWEKKTSGAFLPGTVLI
jgi:hypothetical protein